MNHGARRTHPSHNRLLNERGSRGVQRRATRTKGKKREKEERRRGAHVCYDLFDDYRDGGGGGGGDRWRRDVVMLSVTLDCVIQAGWMPLSTASCLNEEAYGCMRTSAHFMNI